MSEGGSPWLDTAGDAASPAVILLHAAVLNRRMWRPVSAHLAPSYRVLAPDLIGHGALAAHRFVLGAAVAHVISLLRDLPAPALVAGDSLGGYVAMAVAATAPDRVAGLVAGGCTFNPVGLTALALRRHGWQARLVATLRGQAGAHAAEAARLRSTHANAPVDAIVEAGLAPRARGDGLLACAGVDFVGLAGRFPGPTLFVNGEHDAASRRDEQRFLASTPRARREAIAGAGHGVSLDLPTAFAERVESLARSAWPTRTARGGA